MITLSNGNVAISSPGDDAAEVDAGAVYIFNGSTGALLGTHTGARAGDQVGSAGLVALPNGNVLICSPFLDSATATDIGAVTFVSGTGGNSVIGSFRSVMGGTASDRVGQLTSYVTVLANGNYVVRTSSATIGGASGAGAVTFQSGTSPLSISIGLGNSLCGTVAGDQVGSSGVFALPNGNYVVMSPNCDVGGLNSAGAVTFCSGTTGRTGAVNAGNSLVGSTASDLVGNGGFDVLANGNYVVASTSWDNGAIVDAGAVTWGAGTTGVTGVLTATNSLLGSATTDRVGSGGVTALTNGNYVVASPLWNNGAIADAGAATWGNGTVGVVGTISAVNSLMGSSTADNVGNGGVLSLTNGNYVVRSPSWDSGAIANVGAVTWGNGASGVKGTISSANSLVGSTADDLVGNGLITTLTNGNYVVTSPSWDNGAVLSAGAATWGSGTSGVKGVLSSANSLVGTSANDLGSAVVTALTNGNYVVAAPQWSNGANDAAGAVVFGNGAVGVKGAVSAANALVGSQAFDQVGVGGVLTLANGNYVVSSYQWSNGAVTRVGAATWCSGTTGRVGVVSGVNSLVGSSANDLVGIALTALPNGDYLVRSSAWDDGALLNVGAITQCDGLSGFVGAVSPANSLVGSTAGDALGAGSPVLLPDGSAAIDCQTFDNGALANAGAAIWTDGTTPLTGRLDGHRVVYGLTSNTSMNSTLVVDTLHSTFCARFLTEGGGVVRAGPPVSFAVTSLADVPGDQGGWLYVQFDRDLNDHVLSRTPVSSYAVWRQVPPAAAGASAPARASALSERALREFAATLPPSIDVSLENGELVARNAARPGAEPMGHLPAGTWALVMTIPAMQQANYTAAIPTISNLAANTFVVTAHPTLTAGWSITDPLSAQSVDNLAPSAPASFAGAYASGTTHLAWTPNGEGDLNHYRLYRGGGAGFTPSPANLIASPSTGASSFDDPTPGGYVYKLSAVDVNGNESPVATAIPSGTVGVEAGEGAVAFALEGARPNPARAGALAIAFALPDDAHATLELLDVGGRRIASREVGSLGRGRHVVNLAQSHRVAPGLYWLRLSHGATQRTLRVAVVE